jgi:hypothetical protein
MNKTTRRRLALTLTLVGAMASQAVATTADRADPPVPEKPALDTAQLTKLLTKRRARQISRLRAYRERGVFPRNTYSPRMIRRVLVDARGTLCAVANLIALDGHRALVDATAKKNRFVVFSTLKSGALYDWIFTSGFTQEELAAIQLPDRPVRNGAWWRAQEQRRLRVHLMTMEKKLVADTKASVAKMVERLQKRPKLIAALLRSMKRK